MQRRQHPLGGRPAAMARGRCRRSSAQAAQEPARQGLAAPRPAQLARCRARTSGGSPAAPDRAERLAQRLLEPLPLRPARQVDEVDDDGAAEIAQPDLARDLGRGREIDVQRRPAAAVDVDRDAGRRGLDQQPAAARPAAPRAPAPTSSADVDLGLREGRLVRVQPHQLERRQRRRSRPAAAPAPAEARGRRSRSSAAPRSTSPRSRRSSARLGLAAAGRAWPSWTAASSRRQRSASSFGLGPQRRRPAARPRGGEARTCRRGTAPGPAPQRLARAAGPAAAPAPPPRRPGCRPGRSRTA